MADTLNVLITGGAGQVGTALQAIEWPDHVVLHAPSREALDLGDEASLRAAFEATPFALVINAGAWTAVDKAEDEVAAAFAANAMGPALLADASRRSGAALIQVSTDYVFDGGKSDAYVETDPVAPLGVYGASKLAGEVAVLTGNPRSVVLRTAWVLSPWRANFLKTMLRLAETRDEVGVVADQFGSPTSAIDIARAIRTIAMRLMEKPDAPTGVYHFVNDGEASWADLAAHVFEESARNGGPSAIVKPITTADYPTPARRPANSRLSTAKISNDYDINPRPWRDAAAEIVGQIQTERTSA